jgi:hypothetical protein
MGDRGDLRAVTLGRFMDWSSRLGAAIAILAVLLLCARSADAQACAGCSPPGSCMAVPVPCGGGVTVNAQSCCSPDGNTVTLTAPGVTDPYPCAACAVYDGTCGTNQEVESWACQGGNASASSGGSGGGNSSASDQPCCGNEGTCSAGLQCATSGCMPIGATDCGNNTYCPGGGQCAPSECTPPNGAVNCGGYYCAGATKCAISSTGQYCVPVMVPGATDCGDGYYCTGIATCTSGYRCSASGAMTNATAAAPGIVPSAPVLTIMRIVTAACPLPPINTGCSASNEQQAASAVPACLALLFLSAMAMGLRSQRRVRASRR